MGPPDVGNSTPRRYPEPKTHTFCSITHQTLNVANLKHTAGGMNKSLDQVPYWERCGVFRHERALQGSYVEFIGFRMYGLGLVGLYHSAPYDCHMTLCVQGSDSIASGVTWVAFLE